MKTILFLFTVLIFGLVSCNNPTSNRGVEIDGVRWATSNVETPGTFARNPESAGGLFTFDEAQNACPHGWRLPTISELRSLRDAAGGEWTAVNGVNGRTFGIAPNRIFLPAVGARFARNTNGTLYDVGTVGHYWSSSQYGASHALGLLFGSTSVWAGHSNSNRANGFSVRCVVE